MTRFSDAVKLQNELAKKVVASDAFGGIERVCGVDVAYDGDVAYCSAVVVDRDLKVVEAVNSKSAARHPYVPGFLMLRESGPILGTLRLLKGGFDLLMVDGHGLLHPRRCGLACYVGVTLDRPAVGVAKSRLCGTVRADSSVELGGKVLGRVINAGSKKLYVSVGHRISLETAVATVQEFSRAGVPEPLRLADINSKMQKRRKGL